MISEDEDIYSRCILHHYLAGVRDKKGISFVEEDFEELYNITFLRGVKCKKINTEEKLVHLEKGNPVSYDKLLIATGAHTFFPPIKGLNDTDHVYGFRNLDDIEQLKRKAKECEHIVIMGGGLIGVDALSGFLHMGKRPSLIEMEDHLLSKQLDKRGAKPYEDKFREQGTSFYFGQGIEEVCKDENNKVSELILTSGERIRCDLLVVTAGVRANVSFLKESDIEVDKLGLVIDPYGRTNKEDVFGAGDVTGRSPIWPAAVKEGIIAAKNMSGTKSLMTDFFASKSTMNFEGVPSMSLGMNEAPDHSYQVEIQDQETDYKKIIYKEGKIYGAILQGDLSYAGILTQLIANRIDVSKVKKPLFDIDYSDFFHIDNNFEFYYEEKK